jgi:hypothetical protein
MPTISSKRFVFGNGYNIVRATKAAAPPLAKHG